jgi:hypothetical protein
MVITPTNQPMEMHRPVFERRSTIPAASPALLVLLLVSPLVPLLGGATGCRGRVLAPNANDGLRAELVERTSERDAARARVSELESEVAGLSARLSAKDATQTPAEQGGAEGQSAAQLAEIAALRAEAAAATPALASIAISSLSNAKVTSAAVGTSGGNGAGTGSPPREGLLTLIVVPSDGLGRFIQIAGWLDVSATVLIPGAPPATALATRVGPNALRGCYRSGFLGTHYTVEQPIRWTGDGAPRAVSVAIEFVDPATGRRFPATATVPFVPATSSDRATDSPALDQ